MRKLLPLSLAAALVVAGCSSSPTNTSGVSGTGSGSTMPSAGMANGGRPAAAGGIEAARSELISIGDRVFFDTDSTTVNSQGRSTLDKQIAWLNRYPMIRLAIEGHADERGTREYNLALGDRRAQAVKNYLTDHGVSSARLRTISYGKERPVAVGSDEQSWNQNRRAVSTIEQ
jgi:peptidoglycan-associated lipoprotein